MRTRSVALIGFVLGLAFSPVQAQLIRGPYLQKSTPSSITIRWRTGTATESLVRYGVTAANLSEVATTAGLTSEHEVTLTGLTAATRYYYSVGSATETLAEGASYFFFSHPLPGQVRPTRIWAIGDCGTFNTGFGRQAEVRDAYYSLATNHATDVWLALGDNAYYDGTDSDYQHNFFEVYPALLRQSAVWSTIGNHETYAVPAGERLPYLDIFTFPEQGEAGGLASGTEKYYSFDYANIHFVCLDSEQSNRTPDGPMLNWLRADLEASTNDWLIAFWHSPPYTKGSHDSDNRFDNFGNMIEMRQHAVRLLDEFGVDLVLSGHSHNYERSYLVKGHYEASTELLPSMLKDAGSGRSDESGAYFKPTAGPGANEGAVFVVAGSSGWATFRTGHHPVMYYDALATGSLVLDIDGPRLEARFLRETGDIDDYFTIVKGKPASSFRIAKFQVTDGKSLTRWNSIPGQAYRVERSTKLSLPDWNPVSTTIVASGPTTSWTNVTVTTDKESYYRIVEVAVD